MSNQPVPTSSPRSVPLRSALRDDSERTPPLSGLTKAVQIAEPDVTDVLEPPPAEDLPPRKQFPATVAKRLSGRAAVLPIPSSARNSISSQASLDGLATYMTSPAQLAADDSRQSSSPMMRPHINPLQQHHHQQRHHRGSDHVSGRLLAQISEWIQHERIKKAARKSRKVRAHGSRNKNRSPPADDGGSKRSNKTTRERRERATDVDASVAPEDTTSSARAVCEDEDEEAVVSRDTVVRHHRAPSTGSASSEVSLDRLQRIIDDNMSALGIDSISNYMGGLRSGGSGLSLSGMTSSGRRHSRTLRYQPSRTASSDTEYMDGDVLVPGCDAVLDNSKTLKYSTSTTSIPLASSGRAASDAGSISSRREDKERQAWYKFKNEIIRLAHTLRLKGWRKVPLDAGETITVERLSGALTNAVYVVSPPADLGGGNHDTSNQSHSGGSGAGMSPLVTPTGITPSSSTLSLSGAGAGVNGGSGGKTVLPNKLLLRIYGPQVEHLIDREKELGVLRRLARKKIGPRLLGTFGNGRFEQFFTATTLTAANLREPETSKQIAKRMRELHDGIELLEEEMDAGPTVWQNWDRWLDTVEATITFLDREVRLGAERDRLQQQAAKNGVPVNADDLPPQTGSFIDTWKSRGYVCGVEWPKFKLLLEKHREMVKKYYGGSRKIRDRLIFAHNDTQYGNILRVRPDERSPLLQPENEHKQLIVIDFEYASANLPGNEFANHFTEWTYNYHDSVASHVCFPERYPRPEQQRRFIRAYVDHRPEFPHQCASSTPRFGPMSLPPLPPLMEQPLSEPSTSSAASGTASAPPTLQSSHAPPTASSASSIVDFMLDARAPPGGWIEEERRREELLERQVDELMEETRLWRAANSAMWVAWGIVQAKVPGFSLPPKEGSTTSLLADHDDDITIDGETAVEGGDGATNIGGDSANADDADAAEPEEEFDYLGYSQERAFFVLGDCIKAGLLQLDELPEDVQAKVKMIDF